MTENKLREIDITDPFHPPVIEMNPATLKWYYILPLRLRGRLYGDDDFVHYFDPGMFGRKKHYKTVLKEKND